MVHEQSVQCLRQIRRAISSRYSRVPPLEVRGFVLQRVLYTMYNVLDHFILKTELFHVGVGGCQHIPTAFLS